MPDFLVAGGRPLSGALRVPGAKNAALPLMAAALLHEGPVRLIDCPRLSDVENMCEILRTLGCSAHWEADALIVDASAAAHHEMPEHLSKALRSSIFMLGPLLGRFRRAVATFPGGCEIGLRPIDLHLKALRALGVSISEEHGHIRCDGRALRAGDIHLDYPSVGATENAMMAAVTARGESAIHNAAREPEIVDLAQFLGEMGFSVAGAGSSEIRIKGGRRGGKTREIAHRVLPDRIAAGTFLCAAAITGGDILLTQACPEQLGSALDKLRECGCTIETAGDSVRLKAPARPREIRLLETQPYPGFPTDLQAPFLALCTVAEGASVVVENVFENRFKHAAELLRMGANCTVQGRAAVIRGVPRLMGATVEAPDLRGGAALVLAGLRAEGETRVLGGALIDRGYEALERDLGRLGARIERVEEHGKG